MHPKQMDKKNPKMDLKIPLKLAKKTPVMLGLSSLSPMYSRGPKKSGLGYGSLSPTP
jgi:hypothetical protein